MLRAVGGFLYVMLGLVGSVVTVHVFFDQTWGFLSGDGRTAVIILALLLFWFIPQNLYLRARTMRRAQFAEALPMISAGFSDIHAFDRSNDKNISEAILAGERLCTAVANAMTLITGTRCCASIKLLFEDEHPDDGKRALRVQTFCRSNYYRATGRQNNLKHWITDNTDFLEIFKNFGNPRGSHFFSNRLPFAFNYRNSSFQVCGEPDHRFLTRYWRWPLPYRSTIVVPICPCHTTDRSELVGFLCVDSTQIGAFQANTDIELMSGIADGIYNFFSQLSASESVNEGKKKA